MIGMAGVTCVARGACVTVVARVAGMRLGIDGLSVRHADTIYP